MSMTNVKVEWKIKKNSGASNTVEVFLGRFCVGSVFRDGLVSHDDEKKIKTEVRLPGLKRTLGHFETSEEAKSKVENAINYWLKNAINEEATEVNAK
jgi:hypothetical protein